MKWKPCFQLQLGAVVYVASVCGAGSSLLGGCRRGAAAERTIVVFAAASTADVVSQVVERFSADTGVATRCNYAASSTLARQIAAGAPADVYVSANPEWVDYLARQDLLIAGSRHNLFSNELVVVWPRNASDSLPASIREALAGERIALADPDHVPAGTYARQALSNLGIWPEIVPRVVAAADVRAALRWAELGEVSAAVVYASDAAASSRVSVVARIPLPVDDVIRYQAAACSSSTDAQALLAYLSGTPGRDAARRYGFSIMTP